MPAPGPWMYCYTPPGGKQTCFDLGVPVKPADPDSPDPVIFKQLGLLQEFLSQVTDETLTTQLAMVLDQAVARIGSQLPAGYEFRRAATHSGISLSDLGDLGGGPFEPGPLPDVVGMPEALGCGFLREAGYVIAENWQSVPPASDGLIISQFPPGGVIAAPPGTVTITVGHAPPIFTPPIYVIPDKIPGDIA